MLAVTSSPLSFTTSSSSCKDDDHQIQIQMQMQMQSDMNTGEGGEGSYCDYFGENLLDTIDFDDLFIVGINDEDDDMLPDLEMDPENILSEFPVCSSNESFQQIIEKPNSYMTTSDFGSTLTTTTTQLRYQQDHPTTADREEEVVAEKGRKSSSSKSSKNAGKRKVKVDWTPELHRRFVEAVEQLGVDKAVPSRILELMGIHCLTRHNIASHLQKYRSHRKHLLAREAEASNWSKKRQLYCPPATTTTGGKRDMNTWHVPAIGFPPPLMPQFRPLHVWGHPSVHQSLMHVWPKHLGPNSPTPTPPLPSWASAAPPPPTPAPPDPSFWHSHHHLHTYPVPGIPAPPTMYKIKPGVIGVPRQTLSQPRPLDFHPSKESIDAALGDVMSKPWLPLPLGLKPPSVDGVMVELQRQGVPKIPPAALSLH